MFSRFLSFLGGSEEERTMNESKERPINNPCLLKEEESKQAKEAKERTLRILSDALKKKESLLVEDPKEFGDQKMKKHYSLLTTDLVKDLIQELEKVEFAKNTILLQEITANAYVYPGSEDRTIYLCAPFWEMDPESRSRQGTIIHEVSHFLGYGHRVQENSDRVQKSPQSMLCPLTAISVASALTLHMDHLGTYRDGSYSCCGETSRDTVCEKSWMAEVLRSLRTGRDKNKISDLNLYVYYSNMVTKNKSDLDLVNSLLLLYRLEVMTDLLTGHLSDILAPDFLGTDFPHLELDKEAKPTENNNSTYKITTDRARFTTSGPCLPDMY